LIPLLHNFGLPESTARLISETSVALLILSFILFNVLILILGLRKVLGWIQARVGPNRVGPGGMFQTVADALKLFGKEDVIPALADRWVFMVAPAITFVPAYLVYLVIPWGDHWIPADLNIGVVFISAVTGIGVIGIIAGGWSSNNKYSLLGAMRSASQMVSYEVPLVLAMMVPAMLAGSLSVMEVTRAQAVHGWFILYQPIGTLLFLIASLAETNITPFDIVEAESELVAGYNTEYSSMKFALFFLAEFASSFTAGALLVTFFLGGWLGPFAIGRPVLGVFYFLIKSYALYFVIIWIRATLPRIRVDQLMELGWKALIPIALVNLLVSAFVIAANAPYWLIALANWTALSGVIYAGVQLAKKRRSELRAKTQEIRNRMRRTPSSAAEEALPS
jgi:NADH-quinone oxidoreductase subunit H